VTPRVFFVSGTDEKTSKETVLFVPTLTFASALSMLGEKRMGRAASVHNWTA
jgi:hypothetical protein